MSNNVSAAKLQEHVQYLCNTIGVRLAGSVGECRAAEYVRDRAKEFVSDVVIEKFPVLERAITSEVLEVEIDGQWQQFPASLFGSAPSTGGKTLSGELVWFDSQGGYRRKDLSYLRGKAVVHLGCHIFEPEYYHALMAAEPAFLLFVDTRFPAKEMRADGLFPAYVKEFGALPTMNVAFEDARQWHIKKASRARLTVCGASRPSESSNVIITIPGTDPESGIVYVGGHIDTQAGTVGADDNAIGTAAVLEAARILSGEKHRRTIKLCAFGAEEQLSVGSAAYVRRHRGEIEKNGVFMCNFDSFATVMGWTELFVVGDDATVATVDDSFQKRDIYAVIRRQITPFVDNFSFSAANVPGMWVNRRDCEAGNFYHHRADNVPENLDFAGAAVHVAAGVDIIRHYADSRKSIAELQILSAEQKNEISSLWEAVYGGWQ
ncbi:MAG: M20/M25/M40 family metallo-hydrolase [Lentisphaeria bacterium]|nr:M20/M25/M40 family metallo-hydrolase [Lentisphaeria bacterium]